MPKIFGPLSKNFRDISCRDMPTAEIVPIGHWNLCRARWMIRKSSLGNSAALNFVSTGWLRLSRDLNQRSVSSFCQRFIGGVFDNEGVVSVNEAIELTHMWNPREAMFSNRQIEIAANRPESGAG